MINQNRRDWIDWLAIGRLRLPLSPEATAERPKGADKGSQSKETRSASLPPLLLVGVPLAAKNRPLLAAFAGLKTHAYYAILSLN